MYYPLCVVRDMHVIRMLFFGPSLVVDYFHVQNLTVHSIIKQGHKIVMSFNP